MAASNYVLNKAGKYWIVRRLNPPGVVHKYSLSEKSKAEQALSAIQLNEKKEPKGQ